LLDPVNYDSFPSLVDIWVLSLELKENLSFSPLLEAKIVCEFDDTTSSENTQSNYFVVSYIVAYCDVNVIMKTIEITG